MNLNQGTLALPVALAGLFVLASGCQAAARLSEPRACEAFNVLQVLYLRPGPQLASQGDHALQSDKGQADEVGHLAMLAGHSRFMKAYEGWVRYPEPQTHRSMDTNCFLGTLALMIFSSCHSARASQVEIRVHEDSRTSLKACGPLALPVAPLTSEVYAGASGPVPVSRQLELRLGEGDSDSNVLSLISK